MDIILKTPVSDYAPVRDGMKAMANSLAGSVRYDNPTYLMVEGYVAILDAHIKAENKEK